MKQRNRFIEKIRKAKMFFSKEDTYFDDIAKQIDRLDIHVHKNSVFGYLLVRYDSLIPVLVIFDLSISGDGRSSVTNNMENILVYIGLIIRNNLNDIPIVYRDTQLQYNEVIAKKKYGSYTVTFRILNERKSWKAAALKAFRNRMSDKTKS